MTDRLRRRDFLKASAAFAGAAAAGGFACVEIASAAPIQAPVVDKLSVRVLIDGSYDPSFAQARSTAYRSSRRRGGGTTAAACTIEWGLSLLLESQRAAEQRNVMLDFGYTPEALLNNIELIGVDPSKLDALIVSHGHFDHFGGLHRLPRQIPRRAAGRCEALCRRRGQFLPSLQRQRQGQLTDFGALDRRELAAQKVKVVLAETPTVSPATPSRPARSSAQHREGAAQYAGRIRHEGWARLQRRATTCRPRCWEKSCRTSTSTSTRPAST